MIYMHGFLIHDIVHVCVSLLLDMLLSYDVNPSPLITILYDLLQYDMI